MRKAYLYTILCVLFWTTGPVGSKAALLARRGADHLSAMQVAFWAISLGWLFVLVVLALRGRLSRLRDIAPRGWVILALMGCFGWVGYPVAMNFAYQRLTLAEVLIISNLNPIFVMLLQGAAFGALVRPVSRWEQTSELRERPAPLRTAAGLLACLIGVAVIATGGHLSSLDGLPSLAGALAAVFAAVSWAVYSNLARFVAVRPGRDPRGLADVQNLVAMAMGIVMMGANLTLAGLTRPPMGYVLPAYFAAQGPWHVSPWLPLLAMAVFNYAAGYTLWLAALEQGTRAGGAQKLPPLTYLLLLTSITLGWLLLRQPIGPGFWFGSVLIVVGNLAILAPGRRSPPRSGARGGAVPTTRTGRATAPAHRTDEEHV